MNLSFSNTQIITLILSAVSIFICIRFFIRTVKDANLIPSVDPRLSDDTVLKEWEYKYLRHPFDDPQFFSVFAKTSTDANKLAQEKYLKIFESRGTVLKEFYPCPDKTRCCSKKEIKKLGVV